MRVNEREFETIVLKSANQLIPFKFGFHQLLHKLNFLGVVANLDSFLKSYWTIERKEVSVYDWYQHPNILNQKTSPLWQLSSQITEFELS